MLATTLGLHAKLARRYSELPTVPAQHYSPGCDPLVGRLPLHQADYQPKWLSCSVYFLPYFRDGDRDGPMADPGTSCATDLGRIHRAAKHVDPAPFGSVLCDICSGEYRALVTGNDDDA